MTETQTAQRYYVKYSFYKLDPAWRRLPAAQKAEGAAALAATVNAFSDEMLIRSYNLQGMRGDADFMFWQVTPQLEAIQEDRKSTRLNSSHIQKSRMPSSA